jgi:hypothetical protein
MVGRRMCGKPPPLLPFSLLSSLLWQLSLDYVLISLLTRPPGYDLSPFQTVDNLSLALQNLCVLARHVSCC